MGGSPLAGGHRSALTARHQHTADHGGGGDAAPKVTTGSLTSPEHPSLFFLAAAPLLLPPALPAPTLKTSCPEGATDPELVSGAA